MKLMKHFAGSVAAALLLSIIMAGVCAASAANFPSLDSKGSVSVTIKDDKGSPVGGGSLVFYKVAGVKSDNGYVYDMSGTDFNGAQDQATIESLRGDDDSSKLNESLAKNLKSYADQKSLKGTEVTIGADGKASFKGADGNGADLGLYLVAQTNPAPGYQAIDPFLVSVPFKDGDTWKLDVDATPKPTVAKPSTKSPVSYDPSLEKKVTGKNAPDATFRFSFKCLSGPMAVNQDGLTSAGGPVVTASDNELILQIKGAGSIEVGRIDFTEPGTFTYACSEVDTGEKNFKYDTTEYWMEITVKEEATELVISKIRLKKGGANGEKVYEGTDGEKAVFSFTNTYNETPGTEPTKPGGSLPQTGQLWWPVLVLVLAGVILIVAGSFVKKKRS